MANETPHALPPEAQAAQLLMQIGTGYILSTALQVAVRTGIADQLAAGPRTTADLAKAVGVREDPLYRVLRLLASVGVFEERDGRTFAINAAGQLLRRGTPGSMRDMALWLTESVHMRVYADVMYSLETGRPAIEKTLGMPAFEYLARDQELSAVFNDAMTAFSASVIPAALEAYDFNGIGTLVDVAGGHGEVLLSVLRAHPAMRGVLFDVEHVMAGARERIKTMGFEGRCQAVSGDFFKAVPGGGDAYIMKNIIHDWDDPEATRILKSIATELAGNPNGRVILLESVIAGRGPDFGKIIDMEMMLLPGGRERSAEEFRALFAGAGYEVTRIVPTASPMSVIEARLKR